MSVEALREGFKKKLGTTHLVTIQSLKSSVHGHDIILILSQAPVILREGLKKNRNGQSRERLKKLGNFPLVEWEVGEGGGANL